jgi:hypothetical protein
MAKDIDGSANSPVVELSARETDKTSTISNGFLPYLPYGR